jgi:hypothetical protein
VCAQPFWQRVDIGAMTNFDVTSPSLTNDTRCNSTRKKWRLPNASNNTRASTEVQFVIEKGRRVDRELSRVLCSSHRVIGSPSLAARMFVAAAQAFAEAL